MCPVWGRPLTFSMSILDMRTKQSIGLVYTNALTESDSDAIYQPTWSNQITRCNDV